MAGASLLAGYAGLEGGKDAAPRAVADRLRWRSSRPRLIPTTWRSAFCEGIRECGLDVRGPEGAAEAEPGGVRSGDLHQYECRGDRRGSGGFPDAGRGGSRASARARAIGAIRTRWRRWLATGREIPEFRCAVRRSQSRRRQPGPGVRGSRRNLSAELGAARGPGRFAGQDENASLGGRDAVDEKLLRPGAGLRVRLAEERAAPGGHRRIDCRARRGFSAAASRSSTGSSGWKATVRFRGRRNRPACW